MEVINLRKNAIQRCLCTNEGAVELHTFVDDVEDAYASVVYVCSNGNGKSRRLVASKTKVAPLKSMTIPRLELMAAVLGVRKRGYNKSLRNEEVHFWSDSMNVLY